MSFQQGLSGLNMASMGLDAVGNNIANVGTVGFKQASAQFADVYAATLNGASSSNSIGQGGGVMSVSQKFTQGNVTSTNNPLDLAVNGNGFFRVQPGLTDDTAQYTRNGQMHLDSEGYIVNAQDQYLCVYHSSNDMIDTTEAKPIQLDNSQLQPQATGYSNIDSPGEGGVEVGLNFDVRDKRASFDAATTPAEGWTALTPWSFDANSPTPDMYNYSTSSTVFDQRGEPHILTMYFVRQPATAVDPTVGGSEWQTHFILDNQYEIRNFTDGVNVTNYGDAAALGLPLTFGANGQLDETTYQSSYVLALDSGVFDKTGTELPPPGLTGVPLSYFPDAVSEPNYQFTVSFSGASQFGSSYDVSSMTQDGYAPGRISGVAIDETGMITARYSNGKSKLMGQVMLATFQNPNGLSPLGNNLWAATAASGAALEGTPDTGNRGAIQAGAVEDANVDLTAELVNMITLQRAYQANAQTIKTQDQILQTMVNLR